MSLPQAIYYIIVYDVFALQCPTGKTDNNRVYCIEGSFDGQNFVMKVSPIMLV